MGGVTSTDINLLKGATAGSSADGKVVTQSAGNVSLNGNLTVTKDVSFNSKLKVGNDVSFNSKLTVVNDASFNRNVDISGNLVIWGNLSVYQQKDTMVINTTINNYEILATKDISLNGNLVVSKDVSLNSKLFVKTDLSVNGNIKVGNALVLPIGSGGTNGPIGSLRYNIVNGVESNNGTAWSNVGGVISTSKNVKITASDNNGLQFYATPLATYNGNGNVPQEVMRIDNSGNVGIGITNAETGAGLILPAAAFTISRPAPTVGTGDSTATTNFTPTELLRLQLTDNNSGSPNQAIGSGAKISFYNNTDTAYGSVDSMYEMASISGIKLDNIDYNYAGGLVFCTHSNVTSASASPVATERMRITANGNVGIGTIAPACPLDVSGNASISGILSLIDLSSTRINNTYLFRKNNSLMLTCSGDNVPYYTSTFNSDNSVYIGAFAGTSATIASNNVFIGTYAGNKTTTGQHNTFIGSNAGAKCIGGNYNTFIGEFTGYNVTAGSYNVTVGKGAGWRLGSGSNNTFIGTEADFKTETPTDNIPANTQWQCSTAIGYRAKIYGNDQVILGDLTNSAVWTYTSNMEATTFNAKSDYRIKDCVLSLPDCSFVVDPLRPVYYRNKLTNKQDIGLIAHEVQEHFPFLVTGEKDGEHNQSVNYTGFIGLLIHEIQQLKQRVSDLEKQANK